MKQKKIKPLLALLFVCVNFSVKAQQTVTLADIKRFDEESITITK